MLPLFRDTNVRTQQYAFSHPDVLLFATQFAQTTLVVTVKTAFEDMQRKGVFETVYRMLLGEYSILASVTGVLRSFMSFLSGNHRAACC